MSKVHSFNEGLDFEAGYKPLAEPYIQSILEKIGPLEYFRDISASERGIKDKTDYEFKWLHGELALSLELKVRRSFVTDLLIETWSNAHTVLGWISTSKADYLAYLGPGNIHGSILKGPILSMTQLRKWWQQQREDKFPMKEAKNKSWTTEFRIVPWRAIPKDCFLHDIRSG